MITHFYSLFCLSLPFSRPLVSVRSSTPPPRRRRPPPRLRARCHRLPLSLSRTLRSTLFNPCDRRRTNDAKKSRLRRACSQCETMRIDRPSHWGLYHCRFHAVTVRYRHSSTELSVVFSCDALHGRARRSIISAERFRHFFSCFWLQRGVGVLGVACELRSCAPLPPRRFCADSPLG